MPRTGSRQEFDNFDDWENFDFEEDLYTNGESELLDDWEDDGAIAEVREPLSRAQVALEDSVVPDINPDQDAFEPGESAEVFSLLERSQSKKANALLDVSGPSEDELSKIEEIGIDDYIDIVLAEDVESANMDEIKLEAEDEQVETVEKPDVEISQSQENVDLVFDDEYSSEDVVLVAEPLFEGIAVSIPTLFDEDGEVEYKNTARLAKRLENNNVKAVFVATSDGEGNTLSRKERKKLVEAISKQCETLICADVTAPSVRQSVQIANDCIEAGATSLMVTLDANVRDPYVLCESIHEQNKDVSIFVKLVGDPLSLPITPEFLYDLPITGVVDATGDITFFMHLMDSYSGPVYVGSTSMVLVGAAMGAKGVVLASVAINAELVEKAFECDAAAQAEISHWERETGGSQSRAIKLALESENLVCSNMRD